jgi:hypothetical protein
MEALVLPMEDHAGLAFGPGLSDLINNHAALRGMTEQEPFSRSSRILDRRMLSFDSPGYHKDPAIYEQCA